MKKILAIGLILCTVWLAADETSLKKTPNRREGFGGFGFGIMYHNMDKLNNSLVANNYESIDSYFTTIGGGGYGYIGDKILIGGSGYGGVPNESESDSAKAQVNGGGGFFEMGYIVYEDNNFRIWPMIGIGGVGTYIAITPKNTTPTFDEILKNPKRTADFGEGNMAIKLAINSDLVLHINHDNGENMTIAGSLQGGVIYQPGGSIWSTGEGTEILRGPKMSKERFYLGFNIYFGGSENSKATN